MCRILVKEAGSIDCLDSRNWTERLTFVSVIIREAPKKAHANLLFHNG